MKSLNNRHIRHASISRCKNYASNACYYNYAQGLAGALKYLNSHYSSTVCMDIAVALALGGAADDNSGIQLNNW